MKVLNIAVTALFDSLTRNNFNKELLLEGTSLKLEPMLDLKKTHDWFEFVQMYKNASEILGPQKAAREIAYHGLYNEDVSILRKIATGLMDVKLGYWFLATVACRHLFKDSVKFSYQKIKSNQVRMEINISSGLEDCPLLLETYTYLFENVPTVLGHPKAIVHAEISERKAIYTINLFRTSFLSYFFAKFKGANTGYQNAILLMEELETKSLQLSKMVEEKSELLRIMSHDISNSAAAIDMSLECVLRKGTVSEDDRQIIDRAKRSSNRLCGILKNIRALEIAHVRGVSLEPVDLDQVFSAVDECFRDELSIKGIKLVLKNNLPVNIKVKAEKSSLEVNVLSNLISNAIKFSSVGSTIEMEADIEDGQVVITVADLGRGILPEDRKNLFVKKLRHSTVGTSGEVGTGFGLGIVNTYVQLYGGSISVGANYPKGTVFKILLPIYTSAVVKEPSSFSDKHYTEITQTNTLN